jgi:transcriptional regulator with XRE-family HTH domain
MSYENLIAKLLNGRTVYQLSKMWGIGQPRLHRYMKGEALPDYDTAWKMAETAGVAPEEAFKALANEAVAHRSRSFKLQKGFAQTEQLVIGATGSIVAMLSILCKMPERRKFRR